MKKSYYQAYNSVIKNYNRSLQYLRSEKLDFYLDINSVFRDTEISIINAIQSRIEDIYIDSKKNIGIVIRPDALHFIIVNFHQLVILPIFVEYSQREILDSKEVSKVMDCVVKDFNLIIKSAMQIAKYKGSKEVSSHTIIEALHTNWKNLESSKIEIWG